MSRPVDWEDCYRRRETPWDKGRPAPGLVDFLEARPSLPRGRVLVPGCGLGHDARAWAQSGHAVEGMDLAATAVAAAAQVVAEANLRFRVGDFLADPISKPYDWLFEHTLFCAIPPERRGNYAESAAKAVRRGGFFLAIHYFNPRDPAGPPFGVARDEVLERFSGGFDLLAEWVPRSFEGRTGRERVFWWRHRQHSA